VARTVRGADTRREAEEIVTPRGRRREVTEEIERRAHPELEHAVEVEAAEAASVLGAIAKALAKG
jgi:hypothetical protein